MRSPTPLFLVLLLATAAACGSSGDGPDASASVDSVASQDARSVDAPPGADAPRADAPPPDAPLGFLCANPGECGGYPCCGTLLPESRFEIIATSCEIPSCPGGTVPICGSPADCPFDRPTCAPAGDGTGLSYCRAD